ncbi:MAG: mucoidy inhibitor MuiA family protein [Bacteroidales bacterium]|nr:MAG: mucoidy inhibitor MuiA family protein [Bacteroidales bacterium]
MKKLILLAILIPLLTTLLPAQEKRVKSKVVLATVYSQGAQITRVAKFNLAKGENRIVFTNLPPNFDESSIQVNCSEATIISVSYQKNMLDSLAQNIEYQKLITRKKELERKLKIEKALQQTIVTEKDVLLSNKEIIGDQGIKLEDLKLTLTYIRSKLEEYDRTWIEKAEIIANIEEELRKIGAQMGAIYSQGVKSTSEILVTYSASQASENTTVIKYFSREAGWYPTYDVRVKNITEPLSITCKANVYQTTGEDWSKVKLSVSSGNPTSGSTLPSIDPWYIDIINPYRDKNVSAYGPKRQALKSYDVEEVVATEYEKKESVDDYSIPVSVLESQTNFTFNIDIPYDIPSKPQPITAVLQTPTIKATYQYSTVPKLSEYAFLIANLTDWQELNLLGGDANLYFENNFVGSTYFDIKAFSDTLKLSLGKDEGVSVKRTKAKAFTEKNLVGSRITETRSWEITITNGKKQEVDIIIEDQIPVSSNEKVKVKLIEQGGANYTTTTGMLKWPIRIKASETKKIQFAYTVEYPKGSQVILE